MSSGTFVTPEELRAAQEKHDAYLAKWKRLRRVVMDACARVGALLLKHADGLTLRDLRRRLPDQPDVATALVALLQHGEGRARPGRCGRCDGIHQKVLK